MLPQEASNAWVIIAKLEQPHRYDYVLQCKCGFQSHGYADLTATSPEGEAELALQAARTHLVNRHGAKPVELAERIQVAKFAIAGGLSYEQLDLRVQLRNAQDRGIPIVEVPAVEVVETKAEPATITIPPPSAKPPQPTVQIAVLKGVSVPATKPNEVQTGGVKK